MISQGAVCDEVGALIAAAWVLIGILMAGIGVVALGVEIGTRPLLEQLPDVADALEDATP